MDASDLVRLLREAEIPKEEARVQSYRHWKQLVEKEGTVEELVKAGLLKPRPPNGNLLAEGGGLRL